MPQFKWKVPRACYKYPPRQSIGSARDAACRPILGERARGEASVDAGCCVTCMYDEIMFSADLFAPPPPSGRWERCGQKMMFGDHKCCLAGKQRLNEAGFRGCDGVADFNPQICALCVAQKRSRSHQKIMGCWIIWWQQKKKTSAPPSHKMRKSTRI